MTTPPDEAWAEVARNSRQALALLGYSIAPRCFPDEPDRCGGTWAQHAAALLGTLRGVADHQLAHLGGPYTDIGARRYWATRAELDDRADCQGVTP